MIEAATSSEPGKPHTQAQARAAHAVMSVLSFPEEPAPGLAPSVARVMAEYLVDMTLTPVLGDHDATGPAEPTVSAAALDDSGHTEFGRFLDGHEAHAAFGFQDRLLKVRPARFDRLIPQVARDPEAFAVLYDAERAHFAYYLERLTDRGGDPAARLTAQDKVPDRKRGTDSRRFDLEDPDSGLADIAHSVGALVGLRTYNAPHEACSRCFTVRVQV
ncbi:hypothetical protein [Streptomyces sp. NPDC050264]|uniref:hypothetical protein n=1 Tax=Streptomyces sp. NPDC050264 TaxID=3155038 RepID=UPI00343E32CA